MHNQRLFLARMCSKQPAFNGERYMRTLPYLRTKLLYLRVVISNSLSASFFFVFTKLLQHILIRTWLCKYLSHHRPRQSVEDSSCYMFDLDVLLQIYNIWTGNSVLNKMFYFLKKLLYSHEVSCHFSKLTLNANHAGNRGDPQFVVSI